MAESEEWPGETETDVAAFADPRSQLMGVRILCSEGNMELEDIDTVHDNDEYTIYRHMLGILEGSEELGNQFPLNCHMHTLNGVSFDKGCYIGQELT